MSTDVANIVATIIKGYVELRLLTIVNDYATEVEKYKKTRNKKLSYKDPGDLHDWAKTQSLLFRTDSLSVHRKTKLTPEQFENVCLKAVAAIPIPSSLKGLRLTKREIPNPWHKYSGIEICFVDE